MMMFVLYIKKGGKSRGGNSAKAGAGARDVYVWDIYI